ncbi:hypothetical protein [Paenibacillus urinalis]|uniref:Uncharacterized protein n=1 Tax=Paenibacillus urinalis TaxID=521520 RepID=A0AAX3MZQ9_9BACL|nr:hypothetical protein [Paenibacillus urinalis]WDH82787.1 hypothetical protein PUW23_00425 [Paenibacillus urinalis]
MSQSFDIDQNQLVHAWQERLPVILNQGDQAQVHADEADQQAIRIHIDAAGRQLYSFDFRCAYVDNREVKVDLIDVEKDGLHMDERTDAIQQMAQDYTRHIHECAQVVQQLTNP